MKRKIGTGIILMLTLFTLFLDYRFICIAFKHLTVYSFIIMTLEMMGLTMILIPAIFLVLYFTIEEE